MKNKSKTTIKEHEDMIEIVGSIIDVFEDFLESKGVKIENKERKEYRDTKKKDDEDLSGLAIIFGSDYDFLEGEIEKILEKQLK